MKLLLKIAYDGAAFCGFQYQPGKRTVQGVLTDAFSSLYGFGVNVTGCSRTDSGVHALGFCLTLSCRDDGNIMKIPASKVAKAAATVLPGDIAVLGAAEVPDDFHPRYSALGKEYMYKIYDSEIPSPFLRGRAMYFPRRLGEEQITLMNSAAGYFLGEHDFTSFMASGSKIKDARRRVLSSSVSRGEDGLVTFSVSADGFLYNMVRIMTGTLLGVAAGRYKPSDIAEIIDAENRAAAGETAPPYGLYLKRVIYPVPTDELINNIE